MSEAKRYVWSELRHYVNGKLIETLEHSPTLSSFPEPVVFNSDYDALRLQLSLAKELLEQCKEKLSLYRTAHGGEYVGGIEYTALERGLAEFLKEVGQP